MERKILYDIFYYYYNINNSNNNSTKQMNKIKNDKYLRKNRHGKNSKHKHKTRKVQSGGEDVDPPSEEEVLLLQKEADEKKKMAEHADPRVSLLANTFPNWIMGKVSSIGHDSQVKLGEEIILTEYLNYMGNHIKNTKLQIEEVENFNILLLNAMKELKKTSDIITPENIDKFNLYLKQIDYNNMFINKTLSDLRTTYEGAIKSGVLQPMPEKPSSPGLFGKIKNTLKGNQKVPNEQIETPGNEKPSLTQRFKQGVSNMGKTVKNAATSAKDAVTSRFSRKKKSDNEDAEGTELQELGSNENKSTQESKEATPTKPTQVNNEGRLAKMKTATKEGLAKMKTATKEGLAKVGTALSNFRSRFTRKNEVNQNNYSLLPDTDDKNAKEVPQPQVGGNKTRKNRQHQYIHEIKQNRTHLFNKEMEIINSIRNFKHGHIDNDNDNTKKQFMRAVKRG